MEENKDNVININKGEVKEEKKKGILERIADKCEEFAGIMEKKFEKEDFKEGFTVGIWSGMALAGLAVVVVAIGSNE